MSDKGFYILLGLGAFVAYSLAMKAAAAVGSAVNPVSRDNIFSSGVNALGDVLDDGVSDDSFSLGSWLYDVTHNDPL